MDTPVLLIILYLLNNNVDFNSISSIHTIKGYLNTMEIDSKYTEEKIQIAKKIIPLLPEEYLYPFNKSIFITERVLKIMDLIDFLKVSKMSEITPIDLDPKERVQKIVSTVQEEVQSSSLNNLGIVLDLLVNMERYKKLLSAFTSIKGNKNKLNDTTNIMSLVDVLMDTSNEKDKEKIKDMSKMFDIIKLLDTPKTEKPNEV